MTHKSQLSSVNLAVITIPAVYTHLTAGQGYFTQPQNNICASCPRGQTVMRSVPVPGSSGNVCRQFLEHQVRGRARDPIPSGKKMPVAANTRANGSNQRKQHKAESTQHF